MRTWTRTETNRSAANHQNVRAPKVDVFCTPWVNMLCTIRALGLDLASWLDPGRARTRSRAHGLPHLANCLGLPFNAGITALWLTLGRGEPEASGSLMVCSSYSTGTASSNDVSGFSRAPTRVAIQWIPPEDRGWSGARTYDSGRLSAWWSYSSPSFPDLNRPTQ